MQGSLLAPCGIDCVSCDLRNLSFDPRAAQRVVEWFRDQGGIGPEEGVPQIIERSMYCRGCPGDRAAHWSPDCAILICCVDERKLTRCSECEVFPCERLKAWSEQGPKYKAALLRLMESRAHNTG